MYKVTAIVPAKKKWQSQRDHEYALEQAGLQALRETQALFLSYIKEWKAKNRPQFRLSYKLKEFSISTTAKVFVIQNNGVDHPYVIRPKSKRFLRFKPKRGNGGFVYARMVKHPGFKAQKFDEQAYDVMKHRYQKILNEELAKLV